MQDVFSGIAVEVLLTSTVLFEMLAPGAYYWGLASVHICAACSFHLYICVYLHAL